MYQISPELEDEINTIMNLQKKLLLLSTENVESSYQYIIDSTFILSFDRPHQLTSILFVAIEYRPWSIPYIAQLCHKLLEHDASINSLSKLKSEILFTIFNKERVKQENLHFLAHCLNVRFFFPQEVVDFIHQFSIDKSGFVKELLEYFAWFAPEIEMTNPSLFQKLFSLYKKQCLNNHCNTDMRRIYSDKTKVKNDNPSMKPIPTKSTRNDSTEEETEDDEEDDESTNNNNDNSSSDEEEGEDLDPELLEFFRNFDKLRENNWELLKKYRLNGCNHNRINIAIKEDDVDEVQRIVSEQNLDVNKTSRPSIFELSMFCQTDPTFIQISAFYGSVECFKYFYLNGADIQKCDEEGKTTVHFAVAGGNNEIIRLLQRANADFRGAGNIATLYHRNEIFKWIYDTIESDVTFVDKYHGTLLESSCGSNNLEVFRFCMEHGTDVNQKNERGWTPLCSAIWNNRVEMVKILLSHKDLDINALTDQGWTALYTAAFTGRHEFINLLRNIKGIDVNIKTKNGWSALFAATADSQIECVHALLDFDDIDVNATTNEGWTPLFTACENGDLDSVCLLLKKEGINVNIQTGKGQTPLYIASQKGYENIVIMLLSFPGIDINACEYSSGKTALHAAAENNHLDVTRTLLYNEVTEVNAKDFQGVSIYISYKTAFDLAFENNFDEVAKILLNRKILM